MRHIAKLTVLLTGCLVTACESRDNSVSKTIGKPDYASVLERRVYFGDLHVHTALSPDAFAYQVKTLPDDAYRYGKGEAIEHISGEFVQLAVPLDFMAVTDHAEYLGVLVGMGNEDDPLSQLALAQGLYSKKKEEVAAAVQKLKESIYNKQPLPELIDENVIPRMWQLVIDAAERHYQPGRFTTFIGYEWSATPDSANLHRNVIFSSNAEQVPKRPLSAFDTRLPEELWSYLEKSRKKGGDVIAIPHNANLSDGLMFSYEKSNGELIDREYASQRMHNEPVVEITQIKGTSETDPVLSPTDELANFELLQELMGSGDHGHSHGSYVREAYLRGLAIEAQTGVNPYRFGLVGGTDSHNGTSPAEEDNYTGKIGIGDATPAKRREGGSITSKNIQYSASGLTGVWAEENTREAIFAALRRKEVYATSGPRIQIYFAALDTFSEALQKAPDWYRQIQRYGTPMGATLPDDQPRNAPVFIAWAQQDPRSAPLHKLQIIKGWKEGEQLHETIYDVACSDGFTPDPKTRRCPATDATVDLTTCAFDPNKGAAELKIQWQDPNFKAAAPAFYYLRVIENPSCRWSSWDAVRNDWAFPTGVPPTIQERAWSSPIWYQPRSNME